MTRGRWLALAVLVAIACFSTWKVDAWRYGKELASLSAAHQSDLSAIANAASIQVRQALDKQQAAEQARTDIDARTTKEKANALAENEKLRADVAAGDRRLRIAGRCRAGSNNMPDPTSTARLDDDSTIELTGAAGRTVFDIRARIIKDRAALMGLQEYVLRVCQ